VKELHYSFERSSPSFPFWEVIALRYAEALHGAGKRREAHELIDKVLEERPGSADAYKLGAQFRRREGKLNEGINYLRDGLEAGAEPGGLLYYLANLYYELGDFNNAREAMVAAEASGMKVDRLRKRLGDGAETSQR
jgi:tetratricopeptide (TPR) repeat protein